MPTPIADSVRLARERLQDVLKAFMPTVIDDLAVEYPDHRLIAPERWFRCRPLPDRMMRLWRQNNIDEVAGFVYREGRAQTLADYSGDGSITTRTVILPFRVALFVQWGGGFTPADGEIEDEWQADRIELYRGAMTDILTMHARDNESVKEVSIAGFDSDVLTTPQDQLGLMSYAMIDLEVFQDISIKR